MTAFWITFAARVPGCIEAKNPAEADAAAKEFGEVVKVERLPYPRAPRLGVKSDCPSFCYARRVSECLGKTACPQRYSCTE